MSTSSSSTIERRGGRITINEYRAVVTVGGRTVEGPWQFTKKAAQADVAGLRRSLLDCEEGERMLAAESQRRMSAIRTRLETDRRVNA